MLYFAYGSNMSLRRFRNRVGCIQKVCNYTLKDYELLFNCGNGYDLYANIQSCVGKSVEGVIYKIDKEQERDLDRYEALGVMYIKEHFMYNGKKVIYYKGISDEGGVRTSAEYLGHIITGYVDHGLKEAAKKLIDTLFENK